MKPITPGEILLEEYLKPLGLSRSGMKTLEHWLLLEIAILPDPETGRMLEVSRRGFWRDMELAWMEGAREFAKVAVRPAVIDQHSAEIIEPLTVVGDRRPLNDPEAPPHGCIFALASYDGLEWRYHFEPREMLDPDGHPNRSREGVELVCDAAEEQETLRRLALMAKAIRGDQDSPLAVTISRLLADAGEDMRAGRKADALAKIFEAGVFQGRSLNNPPAGKLVSADLELMEVIVAAKARHGDKEPDELVKAMGGRYVDEWDDPAAPGRNRVEFFEWDDGTRFLVHDFRRVHKNWRSKNPRRKLST